MKKLVSLDRIVVHGGKSHVDEIVAVMLAEASTSDGQLLPVFRRDPTEAELADNRVLVLDVGMKLDDWSMNFDHHQLGRDAAPECAFSLLSKELDADEDLESFFGWFNTWRMIDSKGPFAWAKAMGIDWDVVSGLINPLSDTLQDWFEEAHDEIPVDEALVRRLQAQGCKILEAAEKFGGLRAMIVSESLKAEIEGVTVYDLRSVDPNDAIELGNKAAAADGVSGGVIVSRDNRGPGDCYYRRNDDPKVDFAQCQGKEYCSFAHVGGFILKTKEAGTDIPAVIADAKKA